MGVTVTIKGTPFPATPVFPDLVTKAGSPRCVALPAVQTDAHRCPEEAKANLILLMKTARLLVRFFTKHRWVITSLFSDKDGRPRAGTSHQKWISLDLAPVSVVKSNRVWEMIDADMRSPRLGVNIHPLIALAQLELPAAVFGEGDHFHIQIGPMPPGVYTAPGLRPGVYKDDLQISRSIRRGVPISRVNKDGSIIPITSAERESWLAQVDSNSTNRLQIK